MNLDALIYLLCPGGGASKLTGDITQIMAQLPPVLESLTGIKFEKLLASAPFPSRVETEMGTHHGYAFSDRGNLHEAAREKHYERMLALYRRYIS